MKNLDGKTRDNVTRDATKVYQRILTSEGKIDMEDIDYLVACGYVFGYGDGQEEQVRKSKEVWDLINRHAPEEEIIEWFSKEAKKIKEQIEEL